MLINTDYKISKICNEDILVTNESKLTISGICNKKVTISENSQVVVTGICSTLEILENCSGIINGTVMHLINNGNVNISGTVKKLDNISNNIIIATGAIVNDTQY